MMEDGSGMRKMFDGKWKRDDEVLKTLHLQR
jgi:hypothetical protein